MNRRDCGRHLILTMMIKMVIGPSPMVIGDWWLVLYLILSSHTITCREGGKGGWRKRRWSNAYDFVYVPCQQYSFNRTILHILLYTYLHQGIQCPLGVIYISCKRIIRGRMWEKQPRWKFQKAILWLHWTLHWISMDWYNNLPKGSNLQLFWSLRQKYQPERPEHQMIIEKIKLKHKSLL